MICPKCGHDMNNSMYCHNCNTYPFKDKETFQWKKRFKAFGVTISCFVVFIGIVIGIVEIGEKHKYNNEINTQYEEIYKSYSNAEYYTALSGIEDFKKFYSDNKKMSKKIEELAENIERKLYEESKTTDKALSLCNLYLAYYPHGKYIDEMNSRLDEASDKQAVEDIKEAESMIKQNDVLSADSKLQSIVNNEHVSLQYKEQAQSTLKAISNKVAAEKGKKKILGTWYKQTGVSYTFEEDGHMSANLSQNYNQSAGTTMDGLEVKMLLGDIEDFGRCIHGGRWEYIGLDTNDNETFYYYNLFYNSSSFRCMIEEEKGALGIMLASGLGDMSMLQR